MYIALTEVDFERMPASLREKLLSYVFTQCSAPGTKPLVESLPTEIHGYQYATLGSDRAGDNSRVVVLNEQQVRDLFSAIAAKSSKALSVTERAERKLASTGSVNALKQFQLSAECAKSEANTNIVALRLLELLASADKPEQATPSKLAEQLKLDDARQLGPALNSISKSIQKIARNSSAALVLRDRASGGYIMHPDSRHAIRSAFDQMNRDLDAL